MISVVIPTFNAADSLAGQLAALKAQSWDGDWELIIADNGSTDDTVALARRWTEQLPKLRIVDASARRGSGAARNIGASAARGDALLFTDDDDLVGPDWLGAMARGLETHDAVAGVIEFAGPASQGDDDDSTDRAGRQSTFPYGYLPFGICANFAVRRRAFEAVGGFDERFLSCQDVDFSWRLQEAGFQLGFEPDAVVVKQRRIGTRAVWRQHFAYGVNDVRLFQMHSANGMKRGWALTAKTFALLLLRLPQLFDSGKRYAYARIAAQRAGRVWGSVRLRQMYL